MTESAQRVGTGGSVANPPDRNLALELVRVTEAAAMGAARWVGRGDKEAADQAAVDVAVDPLEGTRLTANGAPNAIAVIAVAERGTMFFPGAAVYMEKIAVGPQGIDAVDITKSATDNVHAVAEAKGVSTREISVVVLERDRHGDLIGVDAPERM